MAASDPVWKAIGSLRESIRDARDERLALERELKELGKDVSVLIADLKPLLEEHRYELWRRAQRRRMVFWLRLGGALFAGLPVAAAGWIELVHLL